MAAFDALFLLCGRCSGVQRTVTARNVCLPSSVFHKKMKEWIVVFVAFGYILLLLFLIKMGLGFFCIEVFFHKHKSTIARYRLYGSGKQ